MADPFAAPEDVENRWKPLSEAQRIRATVLLADASRMVRGKPWAVDARIAAGTLDPEDVRMVVANMVKRALMGLDVEGVTEQSEGVGPFSVNRRFSNPLGNLYFSVEDESTLEPPEADGGGKRAFVIDLTPEY